MRRDTVFEGLSTINEVLIVHGRLRMGKMGILGAISSVVVFAGLALGGIVGWIWNLLFGAPILTDHEILGGHLDLSIVLVLPIIWIGIQVVKGRFLLSRESARIRQERWKEKHWQLWNADGVYSIAQTNFIMSLFGAVTLLCLFAAFVNVVVSIVR